MSRTPAHVVSVLGSYELALLGLTRKTDSFALEYSVTPPLPDADGAAPGSAVYLRIEAADDLGNEYIDWGGAYGLSPEGTQTRGTVCAQPALPPDAHLLTVKLIFMTGTQEIGYRLSLPLA
ncbi:hypothetical protein ABT104_22305 [Streptomyces mobaraensis]|uniref:hypothetical protein n=1 Tax=Streptomyces mobaraensis TaxID=35621 RepID=UPI00332434E2